MIYSCPWRIADFMRRLESDPAHGSVFGTDTSLVLPAISQPGSGKYPLKPACARWPL